MIDVVVDERTAVHADDPAAVDLRAATAKALREVGAMLRSVDLRHGDEDAGTVATEQARAAVAELRACVRPAAAGSDDRYLPAAALAVNLQRAVEAWV